MPTRQSFYAESLAESSTTSADRTNALALTFTPDDDADYWLFASAAFANSSGSNDHVGWASLYHVQAETVLLEQSVQRQEPSSPQDWIAFFGIAKLSFGTAPGSQQIDVNINSSHAGDTTKIRDVRLLLIKADPADAYDESLAQVNTSSTSWQTAATPTFTPASAGDYLVIASATRASDANLGAMRCRLDDVTGGATYGDRAWYCKDDWDNQAFAVMEKFSLPTASHTLEYRSENSWPRVSGTSQIKESESGARQRSVRTKRVSGAFSRKARTGRATILRICLSSPRS